MVGHLRPGPLRTIELLSRYPQGTSQLTGGMRPGRPAPSFCSGTVVMTVPAGVCRRAGLAWRFGLPPENGLGQFDA